MQPELDNKEIQKKKTKVFNNIAHIEIDCPEIYMDNLCSKDNYKDLITKIQYQSWSDNFKEYGKIIDEKILNLRPVRYDIKNIQDWCDLTGERYIIGEQEYVPTVIIRSKMILLTRNFLCINLPKENFINALWHLSKYAVSPDILDLACDYEYSQITQWIKIAQNNDVNTLNFLLSQKASLLNRKYKTKFFELPLITQLTIIVNDINKLYQWLIEHLDLKSFKNEIVSIKKGLLALHIEARHKKKQIEDNQANNDEIVIIINSEGEILKEIENSIMMDLNSNMYNKLYKNFLSIMFNLVDEKILDHIDSILGNNVFLMECLELGFDINKKNILNNFNKELNRYLGNDKKGIDINHKITDEIVKNDKVIGETVKNDKVIGETVKNDKVIGETVENDKLTENENINLQQSWNSINKNLVNYKLIIKEEQNKNSKIKKEKLTKPEKDRFIKYINEQISLEDLTYEDLFPIYNNAYGNLIYTPEKKIINLKYLDLLIKIYDKNDLSITKYISKERYELNPNKNKNEYQSIKYSHFSNIPLNYQNNKLEFNNLKIVNNNYIINISLNTHGDIFYIKNDSFYEEPLTNFIENLNTCGKICNKYFQVIFLPNKISVRVNKLI